MNGLYKYEVNGEVIYVGKTDRSLENRIACHRREEKFQPYLADASIFVYETANEKETEFLETLLINYHKPILNTAKKGFTEVAVAADIPWEPLAEYKKRHKTYMHNGVENYNAWANRKRPDFAREGFRGTIDDAKNWRDKDRINYVDELLAADQTAFSYHVLKNLFPLARNMETVVSRKELSEELRKCLFDCGGVMPETVGSWMDRNLRWCSIYIDSPKAYSGELLSTNVKIGKDYYALRFSEEAMKFIDEHGLTAIEETMLHKIERHKAEISRIEGNLRIYEEILTHNAAI